MKRMISLLIALALLVSACVIIPAASSAELLPMYVYTANGKTVNVRSTPDTTDNSNIITRLKYGSKVMVEFINASGWAVVMINGREAYIQARFLRDDPPAPKPTQAPEDKEAQERKTEEEKLNRELKSEREITEPFYIAVHATRTSGWINFRVGPSKITSRVASFPDAKELIAIGETTNWYRARDPETQKIGYIHKNYVTNTNRKVITAPAAASGDSTESLGSLNVNGSFNITCKVPAGYQLQVVNRRGSSIVAAVTPDDMTRPQLYLSIAYDETYADIEKMNDLSDEELAILESTFKDMNNVEISYRQTGYGTKLLVARETGSDTDFVDILAIYKGYFVEFNMTPNVNTADQTLTDEQVRMCIDFLTNVEFVPVNS